MVKSIDINVDMGESFGRYKVGNDEEVMKYCTSANLACGFHAGDPVVMRTTIKLAKKHDVAVGAHPGLQDLRGFGRRKFEITPEEFSNDLLYQIGALEALLKVEGVKMQHIKPHGVLYAMVEWDEKYAENLIETIQNYNSELIIFTEEKSLLWKKAKDIGLKVAAEAFPDLKYDSKGNWVIERFKKPWDPIEVAKRALSLVKEGKLQTIDGKYIDIYTDTICFHGDAPNAVDILKEVRKKFEIEGIKVEKLQ